MPRIGVKWRCPPPGHFPRRWNTNSKITISVVGTICKVWIEILNRVKVYNREVLHDLVEYREAGVPLVTVSNHDSCLDDPLIPGLLKMRHLCQPDMMRWALGGHDIMFTREICNWFFSYGQVVPIVRGNGVYQKSMDYVLEQLNRGAWVHIFPEGKVNMTNEYLRLKWGVGRLIAESNVTPIVLPLWHRGFDDILPNRPPYIPRILKKVTVNIGKPMDFSELVQRMKNANKSPMEMRKTITDLIQEEFRTLREATDQLHAAHLKHKRGTPEPPGDKDHFSSFATVRTPQWNEMSNVNESTQNNVDKGTNNSVVTSTPCVDRAGINIEDNVISRNDIDITRANDYHPPVTNDVDRVNGKCLVEEQDLSASESSGDSESEKTQVWNDEMCDVKRKDQLSQ